MYNPVELNKKIQDELSEYFDFIRLLPVDSKITSYNNKIITIKCKKCNTIRDITVRSALRLDRLTKQNLCPECRRQNRISLEYDKLIIKLKNFDLDAITKKESYKSFKNLFTVKCKHCNKIYNIHPASVRFCKCKNIHLKAINKKVYEFFALKYTNFKLINYTNENKQATIKCNKGHSFKKRITAFHRNPVCPFCKEEQLQKLRFDNLSNKITERFPDFKLIYFSGHWKENIEVKHLKCDNNFKILAENFLLRGRCPICDRNLSIGCKKIEHFLKKNKIKYEKEYIFDNLKDKKHLRFDYAIFNNEQLFALIEFDGIQHFSIEKGFFGDPLDIQEKDLKYIQSHDKMKDNYCSENNIKLLRIKYDENVNKKLKELFNDYPNGGVIPQ